MMNAKIITIFGAGGSGKTTVAVNLALSLSKRHYMVGVISSKLYYGELQALFGVRTKDDRGLYQVLAGGGNTKNMFAQTEASTDVFFLSPPSEFDAMLLSAVSMESVKEMLEDAAMRFDYLIVDGSEELNNPISSLGLVMAAQVFIIHCPSVKGCAWYKSMEKMLELLHISEKAAHILNAYDKTCDKAAFMRQVGVDFSQELSYIDGAKICENAGTPIYTQKSRATRDYRRAMDKMAALAAFS